MRRYYISDLVTTVVNGETQIEPAALDHAVGAGISTSVLYPPQDPQTGQYSKDFCFVIVEAPNHQAFLADARIDALPDFPLAAKMSALSDAANNRLTGIRNRRGLTITWTAGDKSYADVIRSFGQAVDPAFSEGSI